MRYYVAIALCALPLQLLAWGCALSACTPTATQVQATTANAIAVAANPVLVTLAETYALQGEALVDQAKSREEAVALLDAHRDRWRPLWRSVDAFGAAHNAWATGLETGATSPQTTAAVLAAWCEVEDAARELDVRLPEVTPCP